MGNLTLLTEALEYVEEHIGDEIRTEDIAESCHCSKSTLEKVFRCVNGISVHDYLVRRRMMRAARQLWTEPEESLLNIALQYGYSTNESFTRAFRNVWNCNPSEFRVRKKFSELFPRLLVPVFKEDDFMRERKRVDISELYDLFVSRRESFFVCCDIKSLIPINDISYKAGDMAILETMQRMCDAAGEEDIVFRIGADEFVMLTDSKDKKYAEAVAEKIRARDGEEFDFEGRKIPLTLYVGVTKPEVNNMKYDELFAKLHYAIREMK